MGVQPAQAQEQVIGEDGTKLLGLDGFAVSGAQLEPDGARVAHVRTADETATACLSCGVISTARKGSATTRTRDVP